MNNGAFTAVGFQARLWFAQYHKSQNHDSMKVVRRSGLAEAASPCRLRLCAKEMKLAARAVERMPLWRPLQHVRQVNAFHRHVSIQKYRIRNGLPASGNCEQVV
jgi:hypothetical protein